MKTTVTVNDFIKAFEEMGRGDQFTREGLIALFNYFDEIDESMELDVIAICCDYCEYKNFKNLKADYSDIKNINDLEEHTTVIHIDNKSFIIQNF